MFTQEPKVRPLEKHGKNYASVLVAAVVLLLAVSFSSLVGVAHGGTVEIAHEIAPGNTVTANAHCAYGGIVSLQFFQLSKYSEGIGALPSGLSYSAGTLVDTGSEYEVPYSITVASDVRLGTYSFGVTYDVFSTQSYEVPIDSFELKFTVNVHNPPTILENLQDYWPVPAGVLTTLGVSFYFFGKYEEYRKRILQRIAGLGALAFGVFFGYEALTLFASRGIHIAPPVSYYVWGLILIIDVLSLAVGFSLVVTGGLPSMHSNLQNDHYEEESVEQPGFTLPDQTARDAPTYSETQHVQKVETPAKDTETQTWTTREIEEKTSFLKEHNARKGFLRPEQKLEWDISNKMFKGKTREKAIVELYEEATRETSRTD